MFFVIFLCIVATLLYGLLMILYGLRDRSSTEYLRTQLQGTYRSQDVIPSMSLSWKQKEPYRTLDLEDFYGWRQVMWQGYTWVSVRHGGTYNAEGLVELYQPSGVMLSIRATRPQKGSMFGFDMVAYKDYVFISQPFSTVGGFLYTCDKTGQVRMVAQGPMGWGIRLQVWSEELLCVTKLEDQTFSQEVLQIHNLKPISEGQICIHGTQSPIHKGLLQW